MLHPLGSLLGKTDTLAWTESDVRHFIQHFMREQLRAEAIYCDDVRAGVARVRVASASLAQEVRLRHYAVMTALAEQTNYELRELRVHIV